MNQRAGLFSKTLFDVDTPLDARAAMGAGDDGEVRRLVPARATICVRCISTHQGFRVGKSGSRAQGSG